MAFNSINEILKKIAVLANNNLSILTGLTSALNSAENVTSVNITDDKGETITYSIPSLSYYKSKMDSLFTTIQDWFLSKTKNLTVTKEPIKITSLVKNSNFYVEDTENLKNVTDKLFYYKLNLTDNVLYYKTNKILVEKLLLLDLNEDQKTIINDFESSTTNLEYNSTLDILKSNLVNYKKYTNIYNIQPNILKKTGNFSVLNFVSDESLSLDTELTRTYKFINIDYLETDVDGYEQTKILKPGDSLISADGFNQFQVSNVNTVTTDSTDSTDGYTYYYVTLLQMSGSSQVQLGVDSLSILSEVLNDIEVKIPISVDEKFILFVKPIDNETNTTTKTYSYGSFIDTNILINSESKILSDYYYLDLNKFSFENYYKMLSQEKFIPNYKISGIISPPKLDKNNFSIIETNVSTSNVDLTSINQQILSISYEISNYQSTLITKQTLYSSENSTDDEKTTLKDEISALKILISDKKKEKIILQKQYSSKLSTNVSTDNTKEYRLIGWWDIPESIYYNETTNVDIIQFEIQYFVGDISNCASTSTNGAEISNWNLIYSKIRDKVWNNVTNRYEWEFENIKDSEQININQLDITIKSEHYGKPIQIKIKSVSEAGYPFNPLKSEYSDILTIDASMYPVKTESTDSDDLSIFKIEVDEEMLALTEKLELLETRIENLSIKNTETNSKLITIIDNVLSNSALFNVETFAVTEDFLILLQPKIILTKSVSNTENIIITTKSGKCFSNDEFYYNQITDGTPSCYITFKNISQTFKSLTIGDLITITYKSAS